MRTLKTTMLFLGISVTSFAQNFVGLDSVRLDNGDDVFSSILKTKKEAIHTIMRVIDANGRDTNYTFIDKKSDVLIVTFWPDYEDRNRVYFLHCNKIQNGGYILVVKHQENVYDELLLLNKYLYIYEPE
jgi:hypothetical protein